MTAALSVAVERGFQWVACASTGNTSAAMAAYAARAGLRSIVFIPEGKIAWGKLSQAMDYGALTVQLKTDFDGCLQAADETGAAVPDLSAELGEPVPAGGAEDPGDGDCGADGVAGPGAPGRAGREPGQLVGAGQGISGDEAPGADPARAQDQRDPGAGREPALSLVRRREPRDEAGEGGDARDRDPHRQSRELEEGLARDRRDGRMVRAGERAGDCAGQGGDRGRGRGLRAGVGGDAGRAEEAGGRRAA